jgi:hypothetical protein
MKAQKQNRHPPMGEKKTLKGEYDVRNTKKTGCAHIQFQR